ncbi:aspartate--tRNA ligase [Candidatus Daviesbacteria bacterium]|nr:aspartate--tRNA ligase [Candidatus Daviesbacteria bacterium]
MSRVSASQTIDHVGQEVTLQGWVNIRRDHGKLIFIDLRDSSGIVQIVFIKAVFEGPYVFVEELRPKFVVEINGMVKPRLDGMENENMGEIGKIEVAARTMKILAKSETPPFDILGDGREIDEALRLKYRYLDLRRPRLQANLRLRHQVIRAMRNFLDEREFVEIETPILTKATPEGARDFLVPSRLQPGQFYALPQSPQQYKQLLMVAGFEKYYQIARCFRDEDPRADRAYGEFTQLDLEMSFATQEDILQLTEEMFCQIVEKVAAKKILQKPFPRFTYDQAMEKFGNDKFDLRKDKNPNMLAFAWVVDFPLFEKTTTRHLAPSHHPFTAPKNEDIPLLGSNPLKVRSWQHDLVCNGLEVGGGSIRITDPLIQRQVFEILGHSSREIEEKFGHLLRAFEFGVPPHGGIAPGIERFLMVLTGEENTRETVAFPMTSSGQTSVMDAPSEVDSASLSELHIKTTV